MASLAAVSNGLEHEGPIEKVSEVRWFVMCVGEEEVEVEVIVKCWG